MARLLILIKIMFLLFLPVKSYANEESSIDIMIRAFLREYAAIKTFAIKSPSQYDTNEKLKIEYHGPKDVNNEKEKNEVIKWGKRQN